jgi:hypothetical protein
MTMKKVLATSAIAIAAAFSPVAHADYVLTFGDVTFTVTATGAQTFDFLIQGVASSTSNVGGWADATQLGAFSFKDIGLTFSTVTASATYGSTTTWGVRDELAASGLNSTPPDVSSNSVDCVAQTTGEKGSVCFDFQPDITPLSDTMLFHLWFSSPYTFDAAGPHLKIGFVDSNGKKVGDLVSLDIPGDPGCCKVPEPASAALVGLGLLSMVAIRRRRSQA